jgi:hypothetical protein
MSGYTWVAPKCSACSRFHSTGSIAKTFLAPAITAPCNAATPTPPTPTTATSSPGRTSADLVADPNPVVTPQLSRHATSNGISGSILTTELRCTTRYGANVPSSDIGYTSRPRARTRKDPSDTDAPASNPAPRSHRFDRPARHDGHRPHDGMNDNAT